MINDYYVIVRQSSGNNLKVLTLIYVILKAGDQDGWIWHGSFLCFCLFWTETKLKALKKALKTEQGKYLVILTIKDSYMTTRPREFFLAGQNRAVRIAPSYPVAESVI